MENVVKKVTNKKSYFELNENNRFKGKLPETFSTSYFSKFMPTNNPEYHLRNFRATTLNCIHWIPSMLKLGAILPRSS